MKSLEKLINDSITSKDIYISKQVLRNNGKQWYKQTVKNRPTQIWEGIYGNTPEFVNFRKELLKQVKTVKPKPPYIFEFDDSLMTDMDMPSSLAPIAPDDNTFIRKYNNCRSMNNKDKMICRKIVRSIISNAEFSKIMHRDVSSSGFPYFITGSSYKKALFNRTYTYKNFDRFKILYEGVKNRNLEYLFSNDFYPIYTQGERKHSCPSNKNREFLNPDAYREGKEIIEKVQFSHPYLEDLHCYDRRSMYALSCEVNISNQILNNLLMHGFKKICDAVDYTGEVDLSQQLQRLEGDRVIFTLDKSKFGETFSSEAVQILFEELKNSKYHSLAVIAENTIALPIIYRSLRRDEWNPLIAGKDNVLRYENQAFKSGHGLVAFMGKFLGTLDAVLMIHDMLGEESDIFYILQNKYKKAFFKNSGDDTLFSIDKSIYSRFDVKKSLHSDNLDKEAKFLGYYYLQNGTPVTSMNRLFENLILNERDYRNKTCPKLGIQCKLELYRQYNKDTDDFFALMCELLIKYVGFDLRKWLDGGDIYKDSKVTVNSIIDKIFLSNPDVIMYKIEADLVSPDLLSHFYHYSEPEEFQHLED